MSCIAVSLNLDSMGHAFGYPAGYQDPTFTSVMDRFEHFSETFGFRYTVSVIGRDLETPSHGQRLRAMARNGHEMGNHTWNHFTNTGALPRAEIRKELVDTHQAIAAATGVAPTGFIAPAWSYSETITSVLDELGYAYDSSLFPSLLYYPFVFKNAWNHRNHGDKFRRVLDRRDWTKPFTAPRDPYFVGNHVMLPVPTTPGPFGMAVWHTTGFLLGWEKHFAMLRAAIKARQHFYYVVHPADLTCDEDFPGQPTHFLERIGGSRQEKMERFQQSLEVIAEAGRPWGTMAQMAEQFRLAAQPHQATGRQAA